MLKSEGQVVGSPFTSRFRRRREWSCTGIGSRLLRREWTCGSGCSSTGNSCSGRNTLGYLTANNVESTDVVIPTALILMGINVELNGHIFSSLNVELFNPVFAKDAENHTARILSWYLNNIVLTHPRVARTIGSSTGCRKNGNDFS